MIADAVLARLQGPPAPLDDLEWRYPDCPEGCGEVEGDGDSLWCPECGGSWDRDGTGGEREVDGRPAPCPEPAGSMFGEARGRCSRGLGHYGRCRP